jgi:hypothetical protein
MTMTDDATRPDAGTDPQAMSLEAVPRRPGWPASSRGEPT